MSEISRRSGLPLTTAHRWTAELQAAGLLERDDRGRYSIGVRLWEIGSLASRRMTLREAALPFMEVLCGVTGENVQVGVLDGPEVVYLDRLSGRQAVPTRRGTRLAAHATSSGIVLLSAASQDEVAAALVGTLVAYTARTVTSPDQLRTAIAAARRDGYAVNIGQVDPDASSAAAPIRDMHGQVVAALSIVVASREGPVERYLPALLAAARGASRQLGHLGYSPRPDTGS